MNCTELHFILVLIHPQNGTSFPDPGRIKIWLVKKEKPTKPETKFLAGKTTPKTK